MPIVPLFIAALASAILGITLLPLWACAIIFVVWAGSIIFAQQESSSPPTIPAANAPSTLDITQLIRLIDSPVLVISKYRVIAANAAAQQITGAHIVGQDPRVALRHPEAIRLLTHPDDDRATIKGLLSPRSLWSMTVSALDDDMRLVQLEDMTAQADISRAHTDFVANASHELRTPLSAIIGYVETLADPRAKVDPATQTRFLDTMGREARRMHSLVEDLMSLSRIEAEKHDLPQDKVDLVSIARGVAKDVNAVEQKERVSLALPNEPTLILGEHAQVDQLLRNLIDNAIKYGDSVHPITVTITPTGDAKVCMSVADKGPGIEATHIPYLTRRFYRTDPGRSRASGGTGLGLAIVKHIVERHRGALDIQSQIGEGTTVKVTFPRES